MVESLVHRQSVIPAENLKRWQSWKARIESKLGPDHPDTLTTRNNIARWTGDAGDAREALRLFAELLADRERVLGHDHPNTLATRHNIALWTGESGDARGRYNASSTCCRTRSGCWGATTPARATPAATSRTGPASRATRRGAATLHRPAAGRGAGARARPPQHARDPPQHRVLDRRVGRRAGALTLGFDLLLDQERVLGRDHPNTLATRHNIASWTGEMGDARGALQHLIDLLPDQERVLGRDHPNTLATRHNIASWTDKAGDAPGR